MSPPLQPIRVLIAEDNPGDLRLIRLALSETNNWPTTVSVARDGEQAIDMLESNIADFPDLVILDFNLPKRSGTYVLRTIRTSDRLSKVPVIVLSSSPEYFLREKMKDAQVNATCYFTKPFDFDEFVRLGEQFRHCYESRCAAT
ncbi:MAG TPA: response regulator [Bryobacteraceae bacterium]|jgi:CheY-like chemotaxis protein|nr:response regulator [Bryobacteraceae bacterium]